MALLRQCLMELRVRRREWTSPEDLWCDAGPGGADSATGLPAAQSQCAGVFSGVRSTGSSTASQAATLGISQPKK
ncbi:hypothetical protein SAMN05444680_1212 [Variovorax sp. YR216]|nr:hypothetical protein SAMN05444680_1212 [Variovorax sp. YR216]